MASEQTVLTVDGPDGPRDMRISSPRRVLWPELGLATSFAIAGVLVLLSVLWMAFFAPETKQRHLA